MAKPKTPTVIAIDVLDDAALANLGVQYTIAGEPAPTPLTGHKIHCRGSGKPLKMQGMCKTKCVVDVAAHRLAELLGMLMI